MTNEDESTKSHPVWDVYDGEGSLGSDFGIDILRIMALPAILLSWIENLA